jgi:hypothetical protein
MHGRTVLVFAVAAVLSPSLPLAVLRAPTLLLAVALLDCMSSLFLRCRLLLPAAPVAVLSLMLVVLLVLLVFASVAWLAANAAALISYSFLQHKTQQYL